jgi:DNA modification methylase
LNRCLIGDCRDVLPTLEAGSVQMCVTSPPYDNLRTYGGHSWDFEAVALELFRVLCDGGVLCWNVGDSVVNGSETLTSAKQKIFFREQCGFRVHDTMIYERLNFSAPETVRYHQMFEYVFVLSKGMPRSFNPIADRPNVYAGRKTFGVRTKRQADGTLKAQGGVAPTPDFGMRGNIWKGNTAGQENPCQALGHPAMMPFWLARDLIVSWSNPGDTVLDPFFGSGTSGKAAELLGRKWIGIEINPAYEQLLRERTAQQGLVLA